VLQYSDRGTVSLTKLSRLFINTASLGLPLINHVLPNAVITLLQTISEDANLEASLQAEALALLQEDKAVAAADIVGAWYRFHRARIARDDKDEDQDPRSKLEDLLKERPSVVHARFASPPFGLVLEAGYVCTAVRVCTGIAM